MLIKKGGSILLTGNGKGKTSSAFRMAIRALGYDQKIGIVQFIKGEQLLVKELYIRNNCPDVFFFRWPQVLHGILKIEKLTSLQLKNLERGKKIII